jgi:hypothetical protein
MSVEFFADPVGNLISFGYKDSEGLLRFSPSTLAHKVAAISARNNELKGHATKTTLIRTDQQFGDRSESKTNFADKRLALLLKECSQEVRLAPRLRDGRRHALHAATFRARPHIPSSPVAGHGDMMNERLGLNDKRTPPVQHQMVNLANTRLPVVFGLCRVLNA